MVASLGFWLLTGRFDYWFTARIDLLSLFVSGVLTIALIGVYAEIAKRERIQSREAERQADIQEDQAAIQEEQTVLQEQQLTLQKSQTELQETVIELQEAQSRYMEANHKPVVQISDWEIVYTADGRDLIKLELENKGNGLAQNLKVKPSLGLLRETSWKDYYLPVGDFLDGGPSPEGIHPFASPVVSRTANYAGESGAVLQAGEQGKYRAQIQFYRNKFDRQEEDFVIVETMSFSEILQKVNNMKSLSLSIELQYQNVLDEVESKEIYSELVEPDGAETLHELVDPTI